MSGKSIARKILRAARRRDFTLASGFAGLAVALLIVYAMFDFVQTARNTDEQVQLSTLRGELAQFLLSLKEDDGSSLLDNPKDFSDARRSIRTVLIKKPMFSYFLNAQNARTFSVENITWEPPRSCVTQFQVRSDPPATVKACFAVLEQDPNGRFIYFSISYSSKPIRRHQRGSRLEDSSHLMMRIRGERTANIYLAFESTPIAQARYPSQSRRFAEVHEISAYLAEDRRFPSGMINAQAYERHSKGPIVSDEVYVTIAGRIDASLVFFRSQDTMASWPSVARGMSVSLAASNGYADSAAPPIFDIPFSELGEASASLEQQYLSQVRSRGLLEIFRSGDLSSKPDSGIWSSDNLRLAKAPRRTGFFQWLSDSWANLLLRVFASERKPTVVEQSINGRISARLRSDPVPLPDIATRAVGWLLVALLCVLGLGYIWMSTWWRLGVITRKAYKLTVSKSSEGSLDEYKRSKGEIGTLGRTFNLLVRRVRTRVRHDNERLAREQSIRSEKLKLQQLQVQARQAVLGAIGHEIKSPLQSLISKVRAEDVDPNLERMRRAVNTLYEATSIETALKKGDIVLRRGDIAAYLYKLSSNWLDRGIPTVYSGEREGVEAVFDPIELEVVVDHVFSNAMRYRSVGTPIEISLKRQLVTVTVEIFNYGSVIDGEDNALERIFEYGVTSQDEHGNLGQGLFIARLRMIGMQGFIVAENRSRGVAFLITLPVVEESGS